MNAVDTNVLIYACDSCDEAKQSRALALLESLPDCVLLWQVAHEFIASSRKLASHGFTPQHAWARLDEFCATMTLVPPSPAALTLTRQFHEIARVSFWDAALLAACADAGVRTLYSVDVPGSEIELVRVVNPFA